LAQILKIALAQGDDQMPNIYTDPVHLGLGATATPQPDFTGMPDWYEAYVSRHASDGAEGRLVAMHSFSENWAGWEMHPHGEEVVLCVSGSMTLIQESAEGSTRRTVLGPGDYGINARGVWHTADVDGEATALFITPGLGTEHRMR
jgi:mannose-6-phosphate isomerase-like protein (cupin superfamily)